VGVRKLDEPTSKGEAPAEQLERHDAERVLIACGREVAEELLRRHVRRCAGYFIAQGDGIHGAGDAEVRQQHVPTPVRLDLHQHVAGLHIRVDHVVVVGILQRVGQLGDNIHCKRRARWEIEPVCPLALDRVGQRTIGRVLHDQEQISSLDAAVIHGQDVGMRELTEQLRLADEVPAGVQGRVGRRGDVPLGADDFDRDQTVAQ
jgi:hypothetical protein